MILISFVNAFDVIHRTWRCRRSSQQEGIFTWRSHLNANLWRFKIHTYANRISRSGLPRHAKHRSRVNYRIPVGRRNNVPGDSIKPACFALRSLAAISRVQLSISTFLPPPSIEFYLILILVHRPVCCFDLDLRI